MGVIRHLRFERDRCEKRVKGRVRGPRIGSRVG